MKNFKLSALKTAISLAAVAMVLTGCNVKNGEEGVAGISGAPGAPGEAGVDGFSSLVEQIALEAGNEHCPASGVAIQTGLDKNQNQQLDNDEIEQVEYLCQQGRTALSSSELLNNVNNSWYVESNTQVEHTQQAIEDVKKQAGSAKNIILFIGDGMGVSTTTAARILEGQQKGMQGEENQLSFDEFDFTGLSKTYNVDAQTPDSAGTMTAMVTGVKTDIGVLSINENVEYGTCETQEGNELITALELAEIAGLSTGIISTARITHATPAATYAKAASRNWEDDADINQPEELGCIDIATQLVDFESNLEARFAEDALDVDGLEVAFGGGRRHFLPNDAMYNTADATRPIEGYRTDGVDLTQRWKNLYPQGQYVIGQIDFDLIDTESTTHAFGLFNESHMQYEAERAEDMLGEPSLTQMTEKAIGILDNNEKGFFLTVEAGRIDHAHHSGNAYKALTDTIELSNAVKMAQSMTNPEETLIIVTADHGHVFTIAGYPKRGNPILGKVVGIGSDTPSLATDNKPYTTLGYTNGPGAAGFGVERADLTEQDTQSIDFMQQALVKTGSETHSGEDVAIYATGPGAHLVQGTQEQNVIFHIMNHAGNLDQKAMDNLTAN